MIYKEITADDKISTKTLLHEAIPITGTIVHRTYGTHPNEGNIQNFTHGMFQSVHDYPYLSSSANHIFDISFGFHANSSLYTNATSQKTKKNNVYNQMAQVLMGYDKDGNIQRFDEDGDLSGNGGTKINDAIFLPFSRLLVKDEIKKGSFELELGVDYLYATSSAVMGQRIKITDSGAATSYKVNSPAGEYGILVAETSFDGDSTLSTPLISGETISGQAVTSTKPAVGLLFYQAGVAVLSDKIFRSDHAFARIRATNGPAENDQITIIAADGTSVTFTAKTSPGANPQFNRGGADHALANLKAAIEANSDIGSKVTVSEVNTISSGVFEMLISQNTSGTDGNKTLTLNTGFASYSINGGSAGSSGAFISGSANGGLLNSTVGIPQMNSSLQDLETMLKSSEISSSADALRNRMYNLQFNNTIELNSTVHFCRIKHNEFNYSTNPTYLSGSQIRVKENASDIPISYITSVGLYSADNQLLAVGKFSEPIRKDSNIELTFRARLDY